MKRELNIDFMAGGKRRVALVLSVLLILLSLASLFTRGVNLGIDFTGGTLIEVSYPESVELPAVRQTLEERGYDRAVVQHFGTARDVLIRVPPRTGDDDNAVSREAISEDVFDALRDAAPQVERQRVEFVGPQIGDQLTEQGGLAMLYALIGILIYVALRFEKRFALGSVVALVHDVIITLGVFSALQIEFDLTVLAAVLAVIGYSLNDTIVVFDRIRENFLRMRKGSPAEVMNASINQTLSRTLTTSFTTLLVVLALFYLGGEIIHSFALALLLGIVVGTYSSIFVASNLTLAMGVSKQDLLPPVETEDEEEAP
nr:protein translocase subunit SecF [Alkalilimnicola sp. S0819]